MGTRASPAAEGHGAARAKFEQSLRIKQQFGDRVGEANTFGHLGVLAAEVGHKQAGLLPLALSAMLLQRIGHGNLKWAEGWVNSLASELDCSQEQFDALRQEVAEAYRQDRGWGLIEAAFRED
ncbi:MAG: hypothetical protein H0V51_25115 [Chloroflexi bacterium]|nr:hypothetical protein [Chloroflexota bacterium]